MSLNALKNDKCQLWVYDKHPLTELEWDLGDFQVETRWYVEPLLRLQQ